MIAYLFVFPFSGLQWQSWSPFKLGLLLISAMQHSPSPAAAFTQAFVYFDPLSPLLNFLRYIYYRHIEKWSRDGSAKQQTNKRSRDDHFIHSSTSLCIHIANKRILFMYQLVISNSHMPLLGMHEMHGRMHPKWGHVIILLVHDPLLSSTYPMIIHTHHVAGNLPKKTLVAKQRPTNSNM